MVMPVDDQVRRIVADTLKSLGLEGYEERITYKLSGGEKRLVALATVLAMEPEVLLLDEPTSALDVSIQAEILNLLVRLRKERGFTYVLVTHDLSVISHMCDRLIVMNMGRIVEEMSVASLRKHKTRHAYTEQLLHASLGYDREAAERYRMFD